MATPLTGTSVVQEVTVDKAGIICADKSMKMAYEYNAAVGTQPSWWCYSHPSKSTVTFEGDGDDGANVASGTLSWGAGAAKGGEILNNVRLVDSSNKLQLCRGKGICDSPLGTVFEYDSSRNNSMYVIYSPGHL